MPAAARGYFASPLNIFVNFLILQAQLSPAPSSPIQVIMNP